MACILTAAGCGSTTPPPGTPVAVTLDDFKVRVGTPSVKAGKVSFLVHNEGPSTHEMLVVRTDRAPNEMPLDANGLAIDEESGLIHVAGEASSLLIGERHRLTLDLPAGHYLLLCNLEGHFLSDMHSAFDVR